MPQQTFAARYCAAERLAGGRCPIKAGLICRLADHECRHGRLAFDRTAPCGCWPEEGAVVRPLPEVPIRLKRPHRRWSLRRRVRLGEAHPSTTRSTADRRTAPRAERGTAFRTR